MTLIATRPVSIAVLPPIPIESMRRQVLEPAGDWTLEDVVLATGLDREGLTVSVDGVLVEPDRWHVVRPEPGQSVIVSPRPGLVLGPIIASIVAAAGITGTVATIITAIVTAVVTIGLSYGLSALANALLAPSQHNADESAPGVRRTIAGGSNAFEPYGPVNEVIGGHRYYPRLAARSYTTVEDGKLYQYALFTFGHGVLELSDLRIEDEPLFREDTEISYTGSMKADTAAFGGLEDGTPGKQVELEVRQGTDSDEAITLFATNVQEQVFGKRLRNANGNGAVTQRTKTGVSRITVIVSCPLGLIWRTSSGSIKQTLVRVRVEYREVGSTGAWTELKEIRLVDATQSSVHASRSWEVTEGTYDVRLFRITDDNLDPLVIDRTEWTSMLTTRAGDVVREPNLCLVAGKFLIGPNPRLLDQFNAVAQRVALDWDADAEEWVTRPTSNPASMYRWVLQGKGNRRPVADSRLSLSALQAWHEECTSKGFEFNTVTQGRVTVLDMLRQVTAAGRASPGVRDGLFSVVRENDLSGAPVQHFTPRNVKSFGEARRYVRPPEAFRVQFVDPDSAWLDTERVVPADGFTEDTASTFERLDMPGITSSDQAYKLGRYHLAVLALRPAEYVIETDFEHLECVRGDWVKFNHDVILVGLASGRVTAVALDGGGNATGVTLDQECPMVLTKTYAVSFRKADSDPVTEVVDTDPGQQTTLTFATPIPSGSPQPAVGDLFQFGESGKEAIDLAVKEIEPLDELGARLTLVDAAPAVLTADTGTIPKYDPQITIPPAINRRKLEKPRVLSVTTQNVREQEGRGPVVRRGLRIQLQPRGAEARS